MIKELIKLATHLDSKGLSKEADYLDSIIKKATEKEEDERMDPAARLKELTKEMKEARDPDDMIRIAQSMARIKDIYEEAYYDYVENLSGYEEREYWEGERQQDLIDLRNFER